MSADRQSGAEEIRTLALTKRQDVDSHEDAEEFPRGTVVDRYVILDPLGNGAMGSVYSAYDPQLDRRVALKFLRRRFPSDATSGDVSPEALTARLVREAQAMGRLSHPNVVTVYDVGLSRGGVFLAMEIVEGGTLVAWLKENKPDWRGVLHVFCEAGEGLAAAHRAGVIHRDFKLDNVMMGTDGRPRVMDFGIARTAQQGSRAARSRSSTRPPAQPPARPIELAIDSGISLPGDGRLTLTGTLLGTPGYMAPEQYDTESEVDERADIFAFCATLYRALYGERAFEGQSIEEIAASTMAGRVRPAPRGNAVPAWVRRVLLQGLSVDARARPASMEDVLAALRADPAKRRRRWLAAAATAAAAAVAVAGVHEAAQRRTRACRAMGDRVAGVWDGPRRAAIERAFRATGVTYASDTWSRVRREIDEYTGAWGREAESACLATRVRRERSEAMFDLQLSCLDERLGELRALSDTLAAADGMTVERAVQAVDALPPVALCANVDRLSVYDRLPSDGAARQEIRALENEVAAAKALVDSGKELQALERLSAVMARVEATGYGPLAVAAALAKGRAESGDPKAAAADFQHAALLADSHRLDPQRAEAWIELGNQAHKLAEFDASHRWTLLATAAIDRIGGDAALEVRRDVREGWTYECEGKCDRAVPLFERALERARTAGLDAPDLVAQAHSGLADAFATEERADEALEHMRVALRTVKEAYGAQHPAVAEQTINLATTQLDLDRVAEGLATASGALHMLDDAAGRGDIPANSGRIGDAAKTVGLALLRSDRNAEAAEQLVRALEIYRSGGEESDQMALAATQLAEARRRLGNRAGALVLLDDATDIEGRVPNIAVETIAGTLAVRGRLALDQGDTMQALQLAERALDTVKSEELPAARALLASARERPTRDRRAAVQLAEQTAGVYRGFLAQLP
jgi:tetratricopeptide (TPR) repeat protein